MVDLRTAALPPKVAEPFYSSAEWIALRDRVRREAAAGARPRLRSRRATHVRRSHRRAEGRRRAAGPIERLATLCLAPYREDRIRAREAHREAGGPLIPGAFWGGNRTGAHAENFSRAANTSKKRPVRGLVTKGNNDR